MTLKSSRTVLIGQAPGRRGGEPLAGRIAAKLARLAGLSIGEYLEAFERGNVLAYWPGRNGKGDRFPAALARAAAARIAPCLVGRRVLFLGRATARAFGFGEDFFRWRTFRGFEAAAFPHPSGVSRWWNERRRTNEASEFLKKELRRMNPRHPIFIISKGRWQWPLTARALEAIGVAYALVIEPQEYDEYASVIDPAKILRLPFSNLGQGSIPARNWVWEYAISLGADRSWILDDNIRGFYRLNHNLKVPVASGTIFRAAEDFVDRYENVALAGFHYFMFASRKSKLPPFYRNRRIYSTILIKNDIPYRWRGRYNEDTDLSLRVLKDGWATILFNAFLAFKETTMTRPGGNTDELYAGDGRLMMAQSLAEQHPDVATITRKWGRWQHQVNYAPFKGNKLIPRPSAIIPEGINNYGMVLQVDE